MIVELYGAPTPKEKVLRLKLVEGRSSITLCAVDENGKEITYGNLLRINKLTGGFFRPPSVNKDLGLSLDFNGRIIIEE